MRFNGSPLSTYVFSRPLTIARIETKMPTVSPTPPMVIIVPTRRTTRLRKLYFTGIIELSLAAAADRFRNRQTRGAPGRQKRARKRDEDRNADCHQDGFPPDDEVK